MLSIIYGDWEGGRYLDSERAGTGGRGRKGGWCEGEEEEVWGFLGTKSLLCVEM
jgi:hypothetical protein